MLHFLPKNKLTWVAVFFLIYAFVIAPQQAKEKKYHPNESYTSFPSLAYKNPEGKDDKGLLESPTNKIINKLKETETGQAFVQTLISRGIREKYGTDDVYTVIAKNATSIYSSDTLKGEGPTATCGSNVTLTYRLLVDHTVLIEERQKPFSFTIGKGQVVPGLETAIVGMKQGGKRLSYIPPHLAFDVAGFTNDLVMPGKTVTYDVHLTRVKNPLPKKYVPENVYINAKGKGSTIKCGDTANVNVTFRTIKGTLFYENYPMSFTVGKGDTFAGLEHGIIGMEENGTRTLIFTHQTIMPFLKTLSENIQPPTLDNVILEVTLLPQEASS